MQNKDMTFTELSVPTELLTEAHIDENAVLQMYVDGGCVIIQAVDRENYDCDGDCENCPFSENECDKNHESSPCTFECEDDDEMTLYDFLNSLSEQQQRAALVHLSVKWAEKESDESDAER